MSQDFAVGFLSAVLANLLSNHEARETVARLAHRALRPLALTAVLAGLWLEITHGDLTPHTHVEKIAEIAGVRRAET